MRTPHKPTAAFSPSIMICAVCFNSALAIVNGHVAGLNQTFVVLAEMAIYGAALAAIITHADRTMTPWFLLTVFVVLTGLLIAVGNAQFNPKYIRDVLVIPVFIMLGMTYRDGNFIKPLLVLHSIIFVVCVIEIVTPTAYAEIFRILEYYVNTRDFSTEAFWNTDSTLFVSATRPGARFFSFVDWHRASSVFLEPVSLGNYCVVATILLVACWFNLTSRLRLYLIGSIFFLLVSCDGRLAATSIGIVLFALLFLHRVSCRWTVLYLPILLAVAAVYVYFFGQTEYADNFAGRVTATVQALGRLDVAELIGLNAGAASSAADFGIVYFILSQSLIGVATIWCAICMTAPDRSLSSRLYVHSIGLFVPLTLLVSNSLFSIKVGALIWFFYGFRYARDLAATTDTELEDLTSSDVGFYQASS